MSKTAEEYRENLNSSDLQNNTVSLIDIFLIFVRQRGIIVGSTIIAAILAVVFLILSSRLPADHSWNYFPDTYKSEVDIMVTWEGMTEVQRSLGVSYQINSVVGLTPAFGNPYLIIITQLLEGKVTLDKIAEEYNLFESVSPSIYTIRTWLIERLEVIAVTATPVPTFSIIRISFSHTDPKFTYDVLNSFIEFLQERFRQLTSSSLTEKKEFVLERITEVERNVEEYNKKLQSFRNKYGLIDIKTQGAKQTNLIAQKSVDILEKEYKIKLLQRYLDDNNPKIRALRDEIDTINQFIEDVKSEQISNFVPLGDVPGLTKEYLELEQDYITYEKLYQKLREELEKIKIEEINTLTNFQEVEKAEVPGKRFKPKREILLIVTIILSFLFAVFIAFLKDYFAKLRQNPMEREKINEIKKILKRKQ